jgi:hypothetical protein
VVPLDPDALATTRATAGAAAGLGATFLICFAGFVGATFASEGHFEPDFACGITISIESSLFFIGTFTCLIGVFPVASIFLFFEASMKASMPGIG